MNENLNVVEDAHPLAMPHGLTAHSCTHIAKIDVVGARSPPQGAA